MIFINVFLVLLSVVLAAHLSFYLVDFIEYMDTWDYKLEDLFREWW